MRRSGVVEPARGPGLAAAVIDVACRWLPALVTGLTVLLALRRVEDFDTWWHLASGRWIAQHVSVPHTDTLSYTVPEHAWINLQWLYDVAAYGLYQLGGADLLVATAALLFGLTTWLLVATLRTALGPVASTLVALWVVVIAQERFQVRPEMVSFPLLAALLWLYATAHRDDGRRLWLVPPLMLLWANTHTLFVIGAVVVVCQMAAALAVDLRTMPANWRRGFAWGTPGQRRLLLSGGLGLGATILNPYGFEGVVFPFRLMSRINGSNPAFQNIGEFRPPFSGYFPTISIGAYQVFFVVSVATVVVAALLSVWRRPPASAPRSNRAGRRRQPAASRPEPIAATPAGDRFDVAGLLLTGGLAYLSLLARRNIALFALGAAPFVGQCLAMLRNRVPQRVQRGLVIAAGCGLPPALVLAAWCVVSNGFYRWNEAVSEFGTGVLEVNFPIRATEFIKAMHLPPRLYNDLTAGGYLTWAAPFVEGVYIDGRLEVYDAEFFGAYVDALADVDQWQAEMDRRGVGTVILFHRWNNRHPLIHWLADNRRWALVYVDEVAVVFVRTADNEALIDAARQRFAVLQEQTARTLLAPVSSWQWPVGRAVALSSYATALDVLGDPDAAVTFYRRQLELGVPASSELPVRIRLAYYYGSRDELDTARMHLRRAVELDPHDPEVRQLQARIEEASRSRSGS